MAKLAASAVHRDGLWVNYQQPWAGIAFNSTRMKTPPASWTDLWAAGNKGRIIVPSLNNTEGYWTLLIAAHLERQAVQGSAIRDRRRLQQAEEPEAESAQYLHQRTAGD